MIKDQILYEDNHLLILNKIPGQIAQADKTGDIPITELAKAYIKTVANKPGEVFMGLPHRLDRPTSGICILAKTSKALTRLNALLQTDTNTPNATRKVQKTYLAITEGAPLNKQGELVHYLQKNETQNKSYITADKTKGKLAKLSYQHLASSDRYHLLQIELHTGRHHQIRAQLAHIGCIIKGDVKYGAKRSNPDRSICLHAYKIAFIHPVKLALLEVVAPVPDGALWGAFKKDL